MQGHWSGCGQPQTAHTSSISIGPIPVVPSLGRPTVPSIILHQGTGQIHSRPPVLYEVIDRYTFLRRNGMMLERRPTAHGRCMQFEHEHGSDSPVVHTACVHTVLVIAIGSRGSTRYAIPSGSHLTSLTDVRNEQMCWSGLSTVSH